MKTRMFGLALAPLLGMTLLGASPGTITQGGERTFELTYVVEVKDIPADAGTLRMWAPYPASDEDQRVLDTRVDSPYPVRVAYDADWGNQIMVIDATTPKDFTLKVTYQVLRRERLFKPAGAKGALSPDDRGQYARFLQPSKFAVINNAVRAMAAQATAGITDPLEKAHAIYRYVLANMRYDKTVPGWGQGDVQRVCLTIGAGESGTGNCTDFHSLFASMMQAEGIPVVFEMGYPLQPGKDQTELKPGGYHCWAKFFVSGVGWIPVDISEASKDPSKADYFDGAICENRIRFSSGRDIRLTPPQQGEPLNYFGPDPYIEIDGQAHKGFTRSIAYRNLARR